MSGLDEPSHRTCPIGKFSRRLIEVVERNVRSGRLSFTTDIDNAIKESDVVFSAVGTPPGQGGEADLRAVWTVATSFAKNLNNYKVFINKSTVPVGTGKKTWLTRQLC